MGFGSSSVSPAARDAGAGDRSSTDLSRKIFGEIDSARGSPRPRRARRAPTARTANTTEAPDQGSGSASPSEASSDSGADGEHQSHRGDGNEPPPPSPSANSSSLPSLSSAPMPSASRRPAAISRESTTLPPSPCAITQPSAAVPSRVPAAVHQATENERAHSTVGGYCIAPTCVVRGSACRDQQALLSSHQSGFRAIVISTIRCLCQRLLVLPDLDHAPDRGLEELGSDCEVCRIGKEFLAGLLAGNTSVKTRFMGAKVSLFKTSLTLKS